jgi:hypothetical protein
MHQLYSHADAGPKRDSVASIQSVRKLWAIFTVVKSLERTITGNHPEFNQCHGVRAVVGHLDRPILFLENG